MSYETRYSAVLRARQDRQSATPEAVAERIRHAKACAQATTEREKAFPDLTPENAKQAIEFQDRRITEIMSSLEAA
jgi:hypothetical protein